MLLAYRATGALIVAQGGVEGRRSIFMTYVGATIAVAAVDVGAKGKHLRISLISIALVALWFAGSRSGWITLLCILYLNAAGIRELAISLVMTAIAALVPLFYHLVTSEQVATLGQISTSGNIVTSHSLPIAPEIIPPASDNLERLLSAPQASPY